MDVVIFVFLLKGVWKREKDWEREKVKGEGVVKEGKRKGIAKERERKVEKQNEIKREKRASPLFIARHIHL